jgi:hypothetical protein
VHTQTNTFSVGVYARLPATVRLVPRYAGYARTRVFLRASILIVFMLVRQTQITYAVVARRLIDVVNVFMGQYPVVV